jgi:hypothetical protein
MQISPTLRHCTPRALCRSIKTNTDSLVKGMILFEQGGRGEKVMVESAPPRQSVVHLFPLVVCCCLRKVFFLIFSQAQKYWRETHLLDPLPPVCLLFASWLSRCPCCRAAADSTSRLCLDLFFAIWLLQLATPHLSCRRHLSSSSRLCLATRRLRL